MTPPAPGEADILLQRLTAALAAVAGTALMFTMVNVTLFATDHGVPWPIALLLDPMVALALATVLYADARLAAWGLRPPLWSTALRWFAGLSATAMNTWTSLWPDGRPGWPHEADPAGVFLHAVPPLLLILLTETVAAYRRHLANHLCHATRTTPAENGPPPRPDPHTDPPPPVPGKPATDEELLSRAAELDRASRTLTGRPVTVRRLRTELGVGPERARRIHEGLRARRPATAPGATESS